MKSLSSRFAKTLISLQKSVRTLKSDAIEESPVYLRSMLRRPPSVLSWKLPWNSCSFIGTVIRPVKRYASDNPNLCTYTLLEVKTPSRDSDLPHPPFRLLLDMRGKLSEISMRHLKPDDYVYVCGPLSSYEKVNASGKREIFYKIFVTELNFVKRKGTNQTSLKLEDSGASDNEKEKRDRLRLWQVFFASSPHEWWDNRWNKGNPCRPDFRHKDTKECLWLKPDDPPWVRKQLQLYDSSMGGVRAHYGRSNALKGKLDDYL